MTDLGFQLKDGEKTIRKESVLWMKSNLFAKSGTLILTNERLVFDEDPVTGMGGGLLGEFIVKCFFKSLHGGVKFDIPLKEITSTAKDKFGMNIMIAVKYGGDKNVKFSVGKKFEQWQSELKNAGAKT